jgi:hypothetical protein
LTHDVRSARADGQADRDLLPSAHAAREQHVREVQACHEQHDPRHRCEQRRERGELGVVLRVRADGRARQRPDLERVVAILGGERLLELPRALPQSGGRRLGRHAGCEPAEQDERVIGAVVEALLRVAASERARGHLVDARWQPDLRREEGGRATEAQRGDADDREAAAVQPDGRSHERRVFSVPLPQRVAHDRDEQPAARAFFFRREPSSLREARAEHREVVRRDDRGKHTARGVALGEPDDREVVRDDGLEHVGPIAQVLVVRPRHRAIAAFRCRAPAVQPHEPPVTLARQRAEEQLVDDGEDGGVGADPQGEHGDGREREGGSGGEHPHRVADVTGERGHVRTPRGLSAVRPLVSTSDTADARRHGSPRAIRCWDARGTRTGNRRSAAVAKLRGE